MIVDFGTQGAAEAASGIYLSTNLAGTIGSIAGSTLGAVLVLRRQSVAASTAAVILLLANAVAFCGTLVWTPLGWYLLRQERMREPLPILGYHDASAVALLLVGLAVGVILFLYIVLGRDGESPLVPLVRHLARRWRFRERSLAWLGRRLVRAEMRDAGETWVVKPHVLHVLGLIPYSAGAWLARAAALWVILANLSGTAPSPLAVVQSVS